MTIVNLDFATKWVFGLVIKASFAICRVAFHTDTKPLCCIVNKNSFCVTKTSPKCDISLSKKCCVSNSKLHEYCAGKILSLAKCKQKAYSLWRFQQRISKRSLCLSFYLQCPSLLVCVCVSVYLFPSTSQC